MTYYEIREKWNMGDKEFYFNIRNSEKQVEKYIRGWIECWRENCEENEYEWEGYETDYKTNAICRIQRGERTDIFRIKVIKKEGIAKMVTAQSMNSFNEKMEGKK